MAKKVNAKSARRIDTVESLARLVDRNVATVSRWTKRDDWPFARRAPWPGNDVPKILRWVADSLQRGRPAGASAASASSDDSKELRKEKLRKEIRKLHANAEQAETSLARERGELLLAAEVEAEWGRLGNVVRNGFSNLASQIVPLALSHGMPHQAAGEFGRQVEESINGVLRLLSRNSVQDDEDSESEVPSEPIAA